MKILVAAFCALLVTPHLLADHHHQDWMNYYPGEWEYEFKSKDAPPEKGTVNWTLEANGKALVGRFTTENGDREVEVAGWDAVGQAIRVNGFSSNGGSWHIPFTEFSKTQIGSKSATGVLPDGKKWKGSFVHTRKGQNEMTTRLEGTMDGKPFVSTAVWKRKSGKQALSTMPDNVRNQIDSYFVGKWKSTASWGKKKITGSHESRWSRDKTAVITEGFRILDGEKVTYFEVMGWNSVAGEITKNGYGSDGSTSTGAWTSFSKDGWKGYGTGNEGGIPWKSLERLEFSEEGVRYVDEPQDDNPTYVAELTRED